MQNVSIEEVARRFFSLIEAEGNKLTVSRTGNRTVISDNGNESMTIIARRNIQTRSTNYLGS